MANALNGQLAVVVVGRDHGEHILRIRAGETLCGVGHSGRNPIRDFPMAPDKACASCLSVLVNEAIGNQTLASPTEKSPAA